MKVRILKDTKWDFGSSVVDLKAGTIRDVESTFQRQDLIKYGFAEEVQEGAMADKLVIETKAIETDKEPAIENKAISSNEIENKSVQEQSVVRRGRRKK